MIPRPMVGEDCKKIEKGSGFHHFFTESELEKICHLFELRKLSKGEILFREGDPGDFLAFLISGKLEVKKQTEFPDKHFVLAMFNPGAFIGEMAIAGKTGHHRSVTVTAIEDSTLALLSHDDFDRLLTEFPASSAKLLRAMLRVVSQRLNGANERLATIF